MRIPFVAGNWKLNGTRASVLDLARAVAAGVTGQAVEVAVCPSFVHIAEVADCLRNSKVALGAQDASDQRSGAYTGEVAAEMLKEYACRYVIVGHSERRHIYAESDALVANKFAAVRAAGLTPILCIGETLAEREAGRTEAVVARQLEAILAIQNAAAFMQVVIAYEPVWAIGTGKTATPDQAQQVHGFIRDWLKRLNADAATKARIVYGGSVKPNNAGELFSMPDIDGGLIGGAALQPADFLAIYQAALLENGE